MRFELYDLSADPSEKSNLATGKPEVVSKLKPGLRSWLESVVGSYNGEDYPEDAAGKRTR